MNLGEKNGSSKPCQHDQNGENSISRVQWKNVKRRHTGLC